MQEEERIQAVYAERQQLVPADYYSIFRPENRYRVHGLETAVLAALSRAGRTDLASLEVLEVGCGAGNELLRWMGWGADPSRLHGVDLIPGRIAVARQRMPQVDLQVANAASLPYPDGVFDVVSQFTVFSSVLDPAIREAIAREMRRVLKPGGVILWYDMRIVRPDRPLVPMTRRELVRLFPGCRLDLRATTLNPLICKLAIMAGRHICDIVSMLPFVKSHYIAVISPAASR